MSTKVKVVFHSLYGHVYKLAEAVAEGARAVPGVEVELLQVAEILPDAVLEKMGALEAKKAFAHVPVADAKKLAEADAILLGTGTRFGSASASMQALNDGRAVMRPTYSASRGQRFASIEPPPCARFTNGDAIAMSASENRPACSSPQMLRVIRKPEMTKKMSTPTYPPGTQALRM